MIRPTRSFLETVQTFDGAQTWTCAGTGWLLLVVIGSIGPWAQLHGLYSVSGPGTDARGGYSLLAATVGGVVLITSFLSARMRRRFAPVVALVSGWLSVRSTLIFLGRFSSILTRVAPMIGVIGFRDGASFDWELATSGMFALLRSK